MSKEEMIEELKKLARYGKKMLVSINDPALDTIRGDFVLGNLLRLIAVSLEKG